LARIVRQQTLFEELIATSSSFENFVIVDRSTRQKIEEEEGKKTHTSSFIESHNSTLSIN
jgi:hypothetical protein